MFYPLVDFRPSLLLVLLPLISIFLLVLILVLSIPALDFRCRIKVELRKRLRIKLGRRRQRLSPLISGLLLPLVCLNLLVNFLVGQRIDKSNLCQCLLLLPFQAT